MEKKLAVIVDNKEEVTTEIDDTEMCSSTCDVAMETCSSERHDTCGDGMSLEQGEKSKTRCYVNISLDIEEYREITSK